MTTNLFLIRLLWAGLLCCVMTLPVPERSAAQDAADGRQRSLHEIQQKNIEELKKQIVVEKISAKGFRAIAAAMSELERRKLAIEGYHIMVYQLGNSLFVLFANLEDVSPDARHRGCAGPRPCLAVQLRLDDLAVVGSTFQK